MNIKGGNLYLNGTIEYVDDVTHISYAPTFEPTTLNHQGEFEYYQDAISTYDQIVAYTDNTPFPSKLNIPSKLGILDTVPKYDMDVDMLRPYAISVTPKNGDGDNMTNHYNSSTKYNNEWLVLKYSGNGDGQPFTVGGNGFKGKVVPEKPLESSLSSGFLVCIFRDRMQSMHL